MGHYNYHATKFKVKKETPPEIMAVLDSLFTEHAPDYEEFCKDPNNNVIIDRDSTEYDYTELWSFFEGNGLGDPCNGWLVKEDKGDHWLFESRANCKFKNGHDLVIGIFFNRILEWLIIEEGDIIHRRTYESANREVIHYIHNGAVKESLDLGCKYNVEWEYVLDERHPVRHESLPESETMKRYTRDRENPSNWMPPWTVSELEPINKKFEEEKKENQNYF
jgi:hypothetical protein